MRVTKNVKRKASTQQVKTKKYRPARRYVNPADQRQYTELYDNNVNNPQTFTYMDFERNKHMIRSNEKTL